MRGYGEGLDLRHLVLYILVMSSFLVSACHQKVVIEIPEPTVRKPIESAVEHPPWSHNLSIYEVNVRQYSPGGTFKEFEAHLPRLKEMGVGILWFMPIHPIGGENRKGSLGSYYSVKDYLGVNPEFGTIEEFESLVQKIHEMGMYVLIDWVANHSAWDNVLTIEHPDWFTKDANGNFTPPNKDWADVIDLNYDSQELREYMMDAMRFWVEEVGVDGFRCDVAGMVPLDFWVGVRAQLEKVKPVFILAEAEFAKLHEKAFDMSYGWQLYKLMSDIAKGRKTVAGIEEYLERNARIYPKDAYRMYFTSNHDENSWNGTVFERLGDGAKAFCVLTATLPGMPLVYSGQEAGLDKRLAFFDKDSIEWKDHEMAELYLTLLNLKKRNRALWNGEQGGALVRVHTSSDDAIFTFVREKGDDKIFAILNLSDSEQTFTLEGSAFFGVYSDAFSGEQVSFSPETSPTLETWGYRVYVK